MLKAKLSNGLIILGLDAENIKRLKEGKPMMLSLAEVGGQDDIVIMYGETLTDLQNKVEQMVGAPMPPPSTRVVN